MIGTDDITEYRTIMGFSKEFPTLKLDQWMHPYHRSCRTGEDGSGKIVPHGNSIHCSSCQEELDEAAKEKYTA